MYENSPDSFLPGLFSCHLLLLILQPVPVDILTPMLQKRFHLAHIVAFRVQKFLGQGAYFVVPALHAVLIFQPRDDAAGIAPNHHGCNFAARIPKGQPQFAHSL